MAAFIDMTGKRIGRLLVQSRSKNMGTRATWLCLCDCGNTITVDGKKLRNGHTKSCGCYRKEISAPNTGRLNVLSIDQIHETLKQRGITLVSDYKGIMEAASFKCTCGHIWRVSQAGSVLYTTGCPICSKRENGFISRKLLAQNPQLAEVTTKLYIIKLVNGSESFYKVGITRQNLTARFRKIPYEVTQLQVIEDKLINIYEIEKQIKRKYKLQRYRPLISFAGHSECFGVLPQISNIDKEGL